GHKENLKEKVTVPKEFAISWRNASNHVQRRCIQDKFEKISYGKESHQGTLGKVSCRRQKALAATGRRTVEEASEWLHFHYNDPSLDDPIPQEYALYLCPTGPLLEKLQDFWRESKRQCGKNRAHETFPHVTLCDFFTVS
uniref:Ubiquitin associated and SH3 domain containing A n=1 Tax=Monodelphis domestica TaxID=13616 RepID=A0A5F8H897_MONDO